MPWGCVYTSTSISTSGTHNQQQPDPGRILKASIGLNLTKRGGGGVHGINIMTYDTIRYNLLFFIYLHSSLETPRRVAEILLSLLLPTNIDNYYHFFCGGGC